MAVFNALTHGAIMLAAAAADTPAALDYGAALSREQAIAIGEAYIKQDLLDPYSAHIEWPFTIVPFSEKLPLSKRVTGYATCVAVNAKNAYGGYTGVKLARIVYRDNKVIDYSEVSQLRFVPDVCKDLQKNFGMVLTTP